VRGGTVAGCVRAVRTEREAEIMLNEEYARTHFARALGVDPATVTIVNAGPDWDPDWRFRTPDAEYRMTSSGSYSRVTVP
jgi:hypothetical protein